MSRLLSSHSPPNNEQHLPSRVRHRGRRRVLAAVFGVACVAALSVAAVKWQSRPAYLDLCVTPPQTEVMLDGRSISLTDGWALLQESPGRHHLSIQAAGYEPQEQVIDLVRGRDNTVRANVRL